MIQFQCGACSNTLKLADDMAGKRGKCPKCREIISVPHPEEGQLDFEALSALAPSDPDPPRPRPIVRRPLGSTSRSQRRPPSSPRAPTRRSGKKLALQLLAVLIVSPALAIFFVSLSSPPRQASDRADRVQGTNFSDDVSHDFERYARASMAQRAQDVEKGQNAAQDWIAHRAEGTTVTNKWSGRYVSSTASLITGDPKFDATASLTWELIKPDGAEHRADEFRRSRSSGAWEQVFKGVTKRTQTDFTTAHESFSKFAPAFLEKIVPGLNADSEYRRYIKGTRSSDAWFEVTNGTSGPEAKLCFDVKGDYALVDAKLMFVTLFRLDGSDWKFVGGRWGYESRWQNIGAPSTFNGAAREANSPFNRMSNSANVQDRTRR